MKEWYYYIRDSKKKPRITVCLLQDGSNMARGVSFCSEMDNPCKKTGRRIAKTRAEHALKIKDNGCRINYGSKMWIDAPLPWFFPMHKAFFNPDLTGAERELINDTR